MKKEERKKEIDRFLIDSQLAYHRQLSVPPEERGKGTN
jgi:hypothetical protein